MRESARARAKASERVSVCVEREREGDREREGERAREVERVTIQ